MQQIPIPEDTGPEARQLIEEVNLIIKDAFEYTAALNARPAETVTREETQVGLDKAKRAARRFEEMKAELPKYGLDWWHWPDTIE